MRGSSRVCFARPCSVQRPCSVRRPCSVQRPCSVRNSDTRSRVNPAAEFLNLCATRPAGSTIAVHCRGGKGRTGSLVSAWLLYSRVCGRDGKPLPPEDVLDL